MVMVNSNFLAALQAQGAKINEGVRKSLEKKPAPAAPIATTEPTATAAADFSVTVDRVLNRNRLDVFFSVKPPEGVLEALRNAGWHFRPSDKAWYHQDSEVNRTFLSTLLHIEWPAEPEHIAPAVVLPDVVPVARLSAPEVPAAALVPVPTTIEISEREYTVVDYTPQPEAFSRYTQQVDELKTHLKLVDSTQLLFAAVDCLHKQTFCQN
jgi:hypothetical protein